MTSYNTRVASNTEAVKLELTRYGSWDSLDKATCFMLDAKNNSTDPKFTFEISYEKN
jgi:hypothetical protein